MEKDDLDLHKLADERIDQGKNLLNILKTCEHIPGIEKVQKKINKELKFIEKAKKNEIKLNHVMCSNLTHYEFLVKVLLHAHLRDIICVDSCFPVLDKFPPLRVDIVCDNGQKWVKVIARNTKSISDAIDGRTTYGAKSILDQAEEYLMAASQNVCVYKPPKIVFYFSHVLKDDLKQSLQELGIDVRMAINDDIEDIGTTHENEINLLNLDITTMIAYVSELTNGGSNWIFKEKILTEQAKRERQAPVKPYLDKLFEGKNLICCETAVNSFNEIIRTLAGIHEKQRAEEFLNRVKIYPDVNDIPDDLLKLSLNAKIKPRSLKIFSFGVHMRSVTITSNEGFIRSAKMKGVDIPAIIHQARALTKNKEINAVPIVNNA